MEGDMGCYVGQSGIPISWLGLGFATGELFRYVSYARFGENSTPDKLHPPVAEVQERVNAWRETSIWPKWASSVEKGLVQAKALHCSTDD